LPYAETATQPPETATTEARQLYLILFPSTLQERVIAILDAVGVPGYSETSDLVRRGPRGRHFNNPIWPGATGEIFTAVGSDQGEHSWKVSERSATSWSGTAEGRMDCMS
jgi:hypothetical protein